MRIRFFLSVIFIALTIGAISLRLHLNMGKEDKARLHRHGVAKVLSYRSDNGNIVTTTIQDTFRVK
jgi:hypothetical protein